jgi:Polyketide cyclase / dehydrase and lipid transport
MAILRVQTSRTIEAPAADLYGILADYREGHPGILPRPPFGELHVERGGRGEGTEIYFTMTSFGKARSMRARVSEPEPGRVLVEKGVEIDLTTTFTVDPVGPGSATVTIATEWSSPIPRAWIERLLAPRFLRGVFARELANLERAARPGSASTG